MIQPQGQFIYQDVQLNSFKEKSTGTLIDEGKGNIQTRLGAKAFIVVPTDIAASSNYRPYVALNWIYNSEDKLVKLDNSYYGISGNSNLGEIKFGVEGQTSKTVMHGLIFHIRWVVITIAISLEILVGK